MAKDFVSRDNQVFLLCVDLKVYSLNALLRTAYWYTSHYFLHLQFQSSEVVEVRFKLKPGAQENYALEQFMNDLLDQALREKVSLETDAFRNLIVAHALSKTCLINPEMERAEPSADPQAISVPDHAKAPSI